MLKLHAYVQKIKNRHYEVKTQVGELKQMFGLLEKQMTGTENFLGWPKEKRECSLEKYESCQMRGYLDKISHCGCSPFDLMSAACFGYQVYFLECALYPNFCIQILHPHIYTQPRSARLLAWSAFANNQPENVELHVRGSLLMSWNMRKNISQMGKEFWKSFSYIFKR